MKKSRLQKSRLKKARLPDAILLGIILESDIATLKTLRLTCHSIYALINHYGNSVKSRILSRLCDQEMLNCFELACHNSQPVLSIFDIDRRLKIAKWIAVMTLRDNGIHSPEEVEDHQDMTTPLEEGLRYLTLGFGIFWRLVEMARTTITTSHPEVEMGTYLSAVTFALSHPVVADLEQQILQKQQEFINSLSADQARALSITLSYCIRALEDSDIMPYPYYSFSDEELGGPSRDEVDESYNWNHWIMIREGPSLFTSSRAWGTTRQRKKCRDKIEKERKRRTEEQFMTEQASAQRFLEVLTSKVSGDGRQNYLDDIVAEGDSNAILAGWIRGNDTQETSKPKLPPLPVPLWNTRTRRVRMALARFIPRGRTDLKILVWHVKGTFSGYLGLRRRTVSFSSSSIEQE